MVLVSCLTVMEITGKTFTTMERLHHSQGSTCVKLSFGKPLNQVNLLNAVILVNQECYIIARCCLKVYFNVSFYYWTLKIGKKAYLISFSLIYSRRYLEELKRFKASALVEWQWRSKHQKGFFDFLVNLVTEIFRGFQLGTVLDCHMTKQQPERYWHFLLILLQDVSFSVSSPTGSFKTFRVFKVSAGVNFHKTK